MAPVLDGAGNGGPLLFGNRKVEITMEELVIGAIEKAFQAMECAFICLSPSLCVCVFLCLCVSVCISRFVSLCVSVSVFVPVSLSLFLFVLSFCICVCLFECL